MNHYAKPHTFTPMSEGFKPVEQFRLSLAEVAKGKLNSKIFN